MSAGRKCGETALDTAGNRSAALGDRKNFIAVCAA
jgi:hypothetical protein